MARQTKKRTAVIEAKLYPMGDGSAGSVGEARDHTVAQELVERIRKAGAFTQGDQAAPAAILWPDGEAKWAGVLPGLMALVPELYSLGAIAAAERTGPAVWLRCIEARAVEASPPAGVIPIFYLPGVSRQELRTVEECPPELEPLVELQFRGAVWSHPNGRDWTPLAFLASAHGGLGLNVPADAATASALDRSIPALLNERVADLAGEKLDAQFLNMLLAPDLPVEILRWMDDPNAAREKKTAAEWQAFCSQCVAECRVHPERDGALRAAEFLGNRDGQWNKVWRRFAEAPNRYPGVVRLLEQAAPATAGMLPLDREYWPTNNAQDEAALGEALIALGDVRPDEAAKAVLALERVHGCRRDWVWREVGRAPLAVALEHLGLLATLVRKPLAGADAAALAEEYAAAAWEADAAALAALAAGTSPGTDDAIAAAVRSLYLPWLDESARNLQALVRQAPGAVKPRLGPVAPAPGRVALFVDGLRFDLARHLVRQLDALGTQPELEWDWGATPTVTPTGKSAVAPMAPLLTGGGPEEEFAPTIAATGQRWTADRFRAYLKEHGIQCLLGRDCGDPAGTAWTEAGDLDSRGHSEGVKSAKRIEQEVRDIGSRIRELLDAGWREVTVVTDHGWLLVPGGLPKVHLPGFLVENRWGRCAAVKAAAATDLPTVPWFWNPDVAIATPPGAGCFRAGLEYSHGGLSAQELVVPRIAVRGGAAAAVQAKIAAVKWVGLRCRVSVQGARPGLMVDIRGRPADANSSKLEGGKAREVGADGTVSLPVGDDREAGNAGVVVLLTPDGVPANSMPTVIGENA